MRKLPSLVNIASSLLIWVVPTISSAALRAVPFEFVGLAGDCGTGYAAGSQIVTSRWLTGMGLPDNGGLNSNSIDPTDNPNKTDAHYGLLLSKNGPTPDCSSAGASIRGFSNIGVHEDPHFALGFDARDAGHCGAGAPRFNVTWHVEGSNVDQFSFVGGCANDSSPTPSAQDPQWTTYRFETNNPAESFPVIPGNGVITAIEVILDEGTDTPSAQDPNGIGLAVLDNIYINGQVISTR